MFVIFCNNFYFQALYSWNPNDPQSLVAVVKEIIDQYKEYQYELIKQYSRKVEFEYQSLHELGLLQDAEVYVHRNAQVTLFPTMICNIWIALYSH